MAKHMIKYTDGKGIEVEQPYENVLLRRGNGGEITISPTDMVGSVSQKDRARDIRAFLDGSKDEIMTFMTLGVQPVYIDEENGRMLSAARTKTFSDGRVGSMGSGYRLFRDKADIPASIDNVQNLFLTSPDNMEFNDPRLPDMCLPLRLGDGVFQCLMTANCDTPAPRLECGIIASVKNITNFKDRYTDEGNAVFWIADKTDIEVVHVCGPSRHGVDAGDEFPVAVPIPDESLPEGTPVFSVRRMHSFMNEYRQAHACAQSPAR